MLIAAALVITLIANEVFWRKLQKTKQELARAETTISGLSSALKEIARGEASVIETKPNVFEVKFKTLNSRIKLTLTSK